MGAAGARTGQGDSAAQRAPTVCNAVPLRHSNGGQKKAEFSYQRCSAPVIMNSHWNKKNTQVSGAALRVAAGAAVFHLCNGAHYLLSVFKTKRKRRFAAI